MDSRPAGRYDIEGRPAPTVRRAIRKVVGGYDTIQVDQLLHQAEQALTTGGELDRARARQALRSIDLSRRTRGYARGPVHALIDELSRRLGAG